jgi:hypothetical protein
MYLPKAGDCAASIAVKSHGPDATLRTYPGGTGLTVSQAQERAHMSAELLVTPRRPGRLTISDALRVQLPSPALVTPALRVSAGEDTVDRTASSQILFRAPLSFDVR